MPGPLWKYRYTDQWGKCRITRYHLTQTDALKQYGPDAEKVEGSRIDPTPVGGTSDFRKGAPAANLVGPYNRAVVVFALTKCRADTRHEPTV